MTREIKFRAWDKNHSKMIYNIQNEFEENISLGMDCFGQYLEYDDCFEVMQYTGLNDRNGNEIYEGDILREYDSDNDPYCLFEVKWGENLGVGFISHGMKSLSKYDNRVFDVGLDANDCNQSEIVGNIYENSELLNSK